MGAGYRHCPAPRPPGRLRSRRYPNPASTPSLLGRWRGCQGHCLNPFALQPPPGYCEPGACLPCLHPITRRAVGWTSCRLLCTLGTERSQSPSSLAPGLAVGLAKPKLPFGCFYNRLFLTVLLVILKLLVALIKDKLLPRGNFLFASLTCKTNEGIISRAIILIITTQGSQKTTDFISNDIYLK